MNTLSRYVYMHFFLGTQSLLHLLSDRFSGANAKMPATMLNLFFHYIFDTFTTSFMHLLWYLLYNRFLAQTLKPRNVYCSCASGMVIPGDGRFFVPQSNTDGDDFSVQWWERELLIENLLVRIHSIIEMIWWTGLAQWKFEFPFPGSLAFAFLSNGDFLHPNRNPKPKTRNPYHPIRNPNPETRNPEPETWSLEPDTRNPELEARNPKPGTRYRKSGTWKPKSEFYSHAGTPGPVEWFLWGWGLRVADGGLKIKGGWWRVKGGG